MKNILNIIVLMLLFFSACTKDENVFSYDDSSFLEISDEVVDEIQVRQGEILKLSPKFDGAKGDYSYLWFSWRNNSAIGYRGDRDTLSREKELEAEIKSSYYIVGEPYKLTFKVTDNNTGVSSYFFYDLKITNVYSEGWIILQEVNGEADFSMILPSDEVIHNIYSSINPEHPIAEPLQVSLSSGAITDDVFPTGRKFYIAGKHDAIELDALTLQKRQNFDLLFFQPPPRVDLSFVGWSGTSLGVIINEGLLSTNFVGGFPGAKKFGLYMQDPGNSYAYSMAPFVANVGDYDWRAHPMVYQHIMYDQQNKRFYNVTGESLSTFPSNASNPAIFDMNDVGLNMKYMAPSYISNSHNAIMYDNSDVFLLQFTSLTTEGNSVITQSKRSMSAPHILEVSPSSIASSTLSGHLFYGYGNTLYSYAINSNFSSEVHTFSSDEEIINVKFREIKGSADGSGQLLLATWNGAESKIYEFTVLPSGSIAKSEDAPVKAGFARVKDMIYKSVN